MEQESADVRLILDGVEVSPETLQEKKKEARENDLKVVEISEGVFRTLKKLDD